MSFHWFTRPNNRPANSPVQCTFLPGLYLGIFNSLSRIQGGSLLVNNRTCTVRLCGLHGNRCGAHPHSSLLKFLNSLSRIQGRSLLVNNRTVRLCGPHPHSSVLEFSTRYQEYKEGLYYWTTALALCGCADRTGTGADRTAQFSLGIFNSLSRITRNILIILISDHPHSGF